MICSGEEMFAGLKKCFMGNPKVTVEALLAFKAS